MNAEHTACIVCGDTDATTYVDRYGPMTLCNACRDACTCPVCGAMIPGECPGMDASGQWVWTCSACGVTVPYPDPTVDA